MSVRSLVTTKRISTTSQWQTFVKSFVHKMAVKASWHRNYVTVTLCIKQNRLQFVNELSMTVGGVV